MVVEPHPPLVVPTEAPKPADAPRRRDPAKVTPAAGVAFIATMLGLIVLAWTILYVTKGRFLKPTFEKYASRFTHRTIRVGGDFNFYFDPINIRFKAERLTIENPRWASKPDLLDAKLINAEIKTISLIFGERRFRTLQLVDSATDLEWQAKTRANTWTFGDPNKPGQPFNFPVIDSANITGTTVHYSDPLLQLVTDIKVDTIEAKDTRFASNVTFTGIGRMRARPFTMNGSLLSPEQTVTGGRNQLLLHARSGATVMDVSGTLPAATRIEGADLHLVTRGPNLRLLFDFLGAAIPDTRRYRFTSDLTRVGGEWRFTGLKGYFGASDLNGKMTISLPKDRLFIDADLQSNKVDIIDVGPMIGYNPQRLDAMGAAGAVKTVAGTPRVLPDAPLRTDSLNLFDAHVDYSVTRIDAYKLPVSKLALVLDLNHSLLTLSPLTFDLSGGHLATDISINARQKPVFTDYDIRLSPTPMGRLLKGFGVEESGTSGIVKARIKLSGAGDTVHESLATSNGRIAIILPAGSFWTRNIQLSELDIGTFIEKMIQKKLKKPVQINCGLIGFTVRDGIAMADPILIDTQQNVILGRGNFSFRDESLHMWVRADAKKFSVFSGQSPVGINGHFAAPGINPISPQLLTRGGAAVALGLVASPLAAVLAFVDPGDAKSAACGPVLAGAGAAAQRTTKSQPRKDVGTGK
jgi:uncharacterized protein involved in outer membrane biogenesis